MIRGFAAGSLALIALYVFVQDGTSGKVEAGGNVLMAGMRRVMSSDVAGVPQRKTTPPAAGSTPPPVDTMSAPNPARRPSMSA